MADRLDIDDERMSAWLAGELDAADAAAFERELEGSGFEGKSEEDPVFPVDVAKGLCGAQCTNFGALRERILSNDETTFADDDLRWRVFLVPSDKTSVVGTLGGYEVFGRIATGGMGTVLKARDPKLNRLIAIKVLSPELSSVANSRARFLREARAVAALEHDHILPIFTVEDEGKTPFFTMRLAAGGSLQDALAQGEAFGFERLKSIARQVADALSAAHDAGIIHRDIKPANILFDEDKEKLWVGDFGIARVTEDPGLTYGTVLAGTPEYMSPEQAEGTDVDGRSDLFSLGSVLYRCALGKAAFAGDTTVSTLKNVAQDEPEEKLGPEFPKWFRHLLESLHEKNPEDRPASAIKVVQAIDDEYAPPPKRAERRRRFFIRLAASMALASVLAMLLLQIPAVARTYNLAVSAATDRDIIFLHRVGAFSTIREAVENARPNEVLTFTSEGPFQVARLEIPTGKSLTFIAGEDVLPRIELGTEGQPGIITRSDLTLKRLSLVNPIPRSGDPGILRVTNGAKVTIDQCYFSFDYTTTNRWAETGPVVIGLLGNAHVRMTRTVMNTLDCRAFVVRAGESQEFDVASASVVIEDSCIRCNQIFDLWKKSPSLEVVFRRSLSLGRIFFWTRAGEGLPPRLDVVAEDSIFNQQRVLNWFGGETTETILSSLSWKGANNLHRSTRDFLTNAPDLLRPQPTLTVKNFASWQKFLGEALPGSEEATFEKSFISQLAPSRVRMEVKKYLEQFEGEKGRGPNPETLGPR
ncbi:MAG: serine/threonine-protein kinase [Verrucomicrobiota bacterium]